MIQKRRGIRSALGKAYNVLVNLVPVIEERQDVLTFGEKDDLPNKIIETVYSSGTASSCISRINSFIQAKGFVDEATNEAKANKTQTFEDLLADLAMNVSFFPGVPLLVKCNAFGVVVSIESVPVAHIRPREDGKFLLNKNFGTKKRKKNEDIVLSAFNPDATETDRIRSITRQKEEYKKQVGELYFPIQKNLLPNGDKLPIPEFIGGFEDIQSDAALSVLENRNIRRGWRPQVVIVTGEIDDETEDEFEKTDKDYFNETLKKFQGEEGAQIMHLETVEGEVEPKVHTLDTKSILNATDKATERVALKVCRVMDVPPVIVGHSTAGKLGDLQELENQIELFLLTVNKRQRMISRALEAVSKGSKFKGLNFDITALNLFKFFPSSLLEKLSKEEIAKLYEITLPKVENSNNSGND